MEDPSTELIDGELAQLASLYDGRIIIIDQNFRVIKDTYGLIENKYVVSEEVIRCFKGETTNQLSEKRFIEMTVPVRCRRFQQGAGRTAGQCIHGQYLG